MAINAPITTRTANGTELTWQQMDGNLISLQTGIASAGTQIDAFKAPTGSTLLGIGGGRTQADKNAEIVSVKDYGAVVDGITDDGASIQSALDATFNSGGGVVSLEGIAVSTIPITIPRGVTLRGIGRGYNKSPISGILFKGAALKTNNIPNTTSITIANPDSGSPYLADSGTRGNNYSTIDFSVNFSAAVILCESSAMEDMAVIPWFDGVSGYHGSDNRMSDDWDVGVWAKNSSGWRLKNVMVDGHWRKAGLLLTSADLGDSVVPENELGEASFCLFGGARAVSIRTPRNTPVTNYGFAGTDFVNCYFRSFDHQSAHLATSSFLAAPQDTPSFCLEMDGPQAMRGIQFLNCTFAGRDDGCMFFGDVNEILFLGCYQESRGIKVSGNWLANSLGSRMVATSNSVATFFHSNTKYGIDFSPYFTADSSLTSQRYLSSGVFSPNTAQDSEWERPNFSLSHGIRLRPSAYFRVYNSGLSSKFSVSETGAVNCSGNITLDKDDASIYANANPVLRRYSASGSVQISNGLTVTSDGTLTNPAIIRPTSDNTFSNGTASFRWSTIYAGTGTINTSDGREKTEPLPIDDAVLDAWGDVQLITFQWLDSIRQKGEDAARWHFGVIAQQVRDAFAAHGLDGTHFGLLCYDEWESQSEVVDEEGNIVQPAIEAGNRWGIRADQCLFVEAAYQRRRMAQLEKRIEALEAIR